MKSLDTRDLQKRLDELTDFRDTLTEVRDFREHIGAQPGSTQEEIDRADEAVQNAETDFGDGESEELTALESLKEEIGGEWRHGVQLIPDSEFEDFAREFAEDVGAIEKDTAWPCCHIDWAEAADSLKMDYSVASFQGVDYLYRS